MRTRLLILGGTYESRLLAKALAGRLDLAITLSLAGRTKTPAPQPVPVRTGGFGGVQGLITYLLDHKTDLLIDATHPFAATISAHAYEAAQRTGLDFLVLRRPPWRAVTGDRWQDVASVEQALQQLGKAPRRIFVALGRQELAPLLKAPQHHYIVRSVDPITPPLALPHMKNILARGPFDAADELVLLRRHKIELIIAKNSGGPATYGKLQAARELRIPVILIKRPAPAGGKRVETIEQAVDYVSQFMERKKRSN